MLSRFSHQTTCMGVRTGVSGQWWPSPGSAVGPKPGVCGALTGLPSRYIRKSVSLIPEKRRPCGAEDTLLLQDPPHLTCMCSKGV